MKSFDLFGNEVEVVLAKGKGGKGKPKTNPLIPVFGKGPDGERCRSCVHQYFKQYAGKYSKCTVRGDSGGYSTDHNSRYMACGKFEPKPVKK